MHQAHNGKQCLVNYAKGQLNVAGGKTLSKCLTDSKVHENEKSTNRKISIEMAARLNPSLTKT